VRFLQLADVFLASSMVPAYTAAAFAKRFARIALRAPPAGGCCRLRLQQWNLCVSRKLIPKLEQAPQQLVLEQAMLAVAADTMQRWWTWHIICAIVRTMQAAKNALLSAELLPRIAG
jgi:hypothetical protein